MSAIMILLNLLIILVVNVLFILTMKKEKWETSMASSFECGFSSYFFSHFSFSVHYFLIALIFLFLDLELCLMMPFFNDSMMDINSELYIFLFILIVLIGLIQEWVEGQLEWIF